MRADAEALDARARIRAGSRRLHALLDELDLSLEAAAFSDATLLLIRDCEECLATTLGLASGEGREADADCERELRELHARVSRSFEHVQARVALLQTERAALQALREAAGAEAEQPRTLVSV